LPTYQEAEGPLMLTIVDQPVRVAVKAGTAIPLRNSHVARGALLHLDVVGPTLQHQG